ncbi:hypothetical protein M422DRAFT_38167 [Sphaerobolus stellatus SS14]|uniref:Uncharacterized protein n=1 Tax=Sphaerobolus stellatus (strain SS14) TaxID=990650 RepID=A0A0C9UBT9_SPHS4|nr:hypothetical protein M422DRAFT_38167 [Sphaerobolus stellatus SS14]
MPYVGSPPYSPPSEKKERNRLKRRVKFRFTQSDLVMAINEKDDTKWELVNVRSTFPYWMVDEYVAVYAVRCANGRRRFCTDEDLKSLCELLCSSLVLNKRNRSPGIF